jgi:hypothetical protein
MIIMVGVGSGGGSDGLNAATGDTAKQVFESTLEALLPLRLGPELM